MPKQGKTLQNVLFPKMLDQEIIYLGLESREYFLG